MELQFYILFLAAFSFLRGLSAQDIVTFSSKEEEQLECSLGNANSLQWSTGDEGLSLCYYPDSSGDVTFANNDTKYMNFNCSLIQANVNLIIRNVEKDDGGRYICTPIPGIQVSYTLTVEALPELLDLTCSPSPSRTCDGPDEALPSSVDCTCTATEVSPRSLQLQWSLLPSDVKREETNDAGAYFNLISEVTVTPTSTEESVNCSLTGYQSEGISSSLIMKSYNFVPPVCTLKVISFNDVCTTAELNCECTGGMPDTYTYSFFHGNKSRIGGDSTTSNIVVDIAAGEGFTFYCRGCNGIYGATSLDEEADIVCIPGTTAVTTTPTEPTTATTTTVTTPIVTTSNPTANNAPSTEPPTTADEKGDDKPTDGGASTAAIVGGVVGGCVVVGGGVIIIILIVKKSGNGDGENNDNTDGNGVNSKLQSEPDRVEYAAVNKPESDPQPAPRSSKPPGNNTEPEKMELQYADIDHSNRGRSNEIHQPADAPTEYATVQSVIV